MNHSEQNRELFDSLPHTWHTGKLPVYDRVRRLRRIAWSGVAAALLLLPAAIAGLRKQAVQPRFQQQTLAAYHVDKGVKGKVVLPDSTIIYLNSASSVKVLSDFSTQERKIWLDGEGWFEVKSDPQHPFYVMTPSGVQVKVTGTRFNLSSYRDEPLRVLLESGRLELQEKNHTTVRLLPDQAVTLQQSAPQVSMTDEESRREATAWREGMLVFNDTPMDEAIARIERWYGVHVRVSNTRLLEERLTGEFVTETVAEVFHILSLTHGFEYTIDNKEVTLR